MIVSLEEVFEALRKRHQINSQPLETITWTWKGQKIEVSREDVIDWEFTGITNIDFAHRVLREKIND